MEGRPLEDAELVRAAQRGDVDAYAQLVERYRETAFRVAYMVGRSAADAEDAAQEAFVKAFYALGRFRPDAPFRPWILRIAANEARNRSRSARRREGLAVRLAQGLPSGDAAPSPEGAALDRETKETLVRALAALPERDRLVIGYRYLLGLSESETAAVLEVRPGTVKSRLSRALDRLRDLLPTEAPSTRELETTDG